jgi:F-type H+-transporting ATPase subunit delta
LRSETIAGNYAEALFSLGEKSGRSTEYAELLDAVAEAIAASPRVAAVLMSPKVPRDIKTRLLTEGMAAAPQEFRLFLAAVVKRGRQGLLSQIAAEYLGLLDLKLNRVRAGITLAREPDDQLRQQITRSLQAQLGKEVVPTWMVDPDILGGVIVRLGDRVLDGSVKRRITRLRRQLVR